MSEEQTGYLFALGIAIFAFLAGTIVVRVYDSRISHFRKVRMKRKFRREVEKCRDEVLSITGDKQPDNDRRYRLCEQFFDTVLTDFRIYNAKSCLTKKEWHDFRNGSMFYLTTKDHRSMTEDEAIRYFKNFEKYEWLKIRPIAS